MQRLGRWLMRLGFVVGVAVGVGMLMHIGFPGASWLLNVAVAKLGIFSSLALIGVGAGAVRVGNRREEQRLAAGLDTPAIAGPRGEPESP